MLIYLFIYLMLIAGILFSIKIKRKDTKLIYLFILSIIFLFSALRYGNGVDFFGYRWHFYNMPSDFQSMIYSDSHLDLGFKALMYIFTSNNLEFEALIIVIAAIIFFISGLTIYKNSKIKILSLFLLFTGGYFEIYFNSGLRQAIAMVIFLYAFYELFSKQKKYKYIFFVLIASLFHKAVLICLLIPFFKFIYNKFWYNKIFNLSLFIGSMFFILIGGFKLVLPLLSIIGINITYQITGVNYLAILLRLVILFLIFTIYYYSKEDISEEEKFQIYIYFLSFILFICVANNSIMSRVTDILMIVEIILIPNLLAYRINKKKEVTIILFTILLIYSTVLIKDMKSTLQQGQYYDVNIINYPYVNIFQENYRYKIYEVRNTSDVFKYLE